jgi:hypothetical protein
MIKFSLIKNFKKKKIFKDHVEKVRPITVLVVDVFVLIWTSMNMKRKVRRIWRQGVAQDQHILNLSNILVNLGKHINNY